LTINKSKDILFSRWSYHWQNVKIEVHDVFLENDFSLFAYMGSGFHNRLNGIDRGAQGRAAVHLI